MATGVPASRVLARLRAGEQVVGAGVLPEPWHLDMLGLLGFDFAWIDGEHGNLNDRDLPGLCLAARGAGCDPIVRIRAEQLSDLYRVLEAGAAGVMLPHCNSEAEALRAVAGARFSPLGERSYSGIGVDARYGLIGGPGYMAEANRETLLVLQIETPRAVAEADRIAAVTGADLLMIGPADLSIAMGRPLDWQHPDFGAAVDRVAAACAAAGKWWGTAVSGSEMAQGMLARGADFICFGSPRRVLLGAYRDLLATLSGR